MRESTLNVFHRAGVIGAAALLFFLLAGHVVARPGPDPSFPQRDDPWLPTTITLPCGEGHSIDVPTTLPGGTSVCDVLHMEITEFNTTVCPSTTSSPASLSTIHEWWLWSAQPSTYELSHSETMDWIHKATVTFYCMNG